MFGENIQRPVASSGIFRGTSKLKVESLILRFTGTFNDQYIRPFVTNPALNNIQLNQIATSIAEVTQQGPINATAVAGVGGSFLTRSAEPEGVAGIVNGWSTQRLRFIMKVTLTNNIGGTNTLFVTGYTDHAGVAGGHLDPNMVFYVNNMYKVRTTYSQTPYGNNTILETVGSQQIITDHNRQNGINSGLFKQNQNDLRIMSPGDIFKALESSVVYNTDEKPDMYDCRFLVDNTGKTAPKGINNSNAFIANTLNSYINGQHEDYQSNPHSAGLKHYMCSNQFEHQDFWKNEFFAALDQFRSDFMMKSSSFRMKDLERVDPNVRNTITLINDKPHELHNAGSTSYWHGRDLNTVSSSIIASSLPSLMSEQLVSRVTITSTNATPNGQPLTSIVYGEGFSNQMDMRENFNRLRIAFDLLVVKDISFNNDIGYMFQVSCDLTGQTIIKIRMENHPEQDFVFPTFCDALFSPILTNNVNNILHVAEDFGGLMSYVQDAKYAEKSQPKIASIANF